MLSSEIPNLAGLWKAGIACRCLNLCVSFAQRLETLGFSPRRAEKGQCGPTLRCSFHSMELGPREDDRLRAC